MIFLLELWVYNEVLISICSIWVSNFNARWICAIFHQTIMLLVLELLFDYLIVILNFEFEICEVGF